MTELSELYLENYFDDFDFFRPECHDRRIREIHMRNKTCKRCQGLEACRMYPFFWLEGQDQREAEDEKLNQD